MYWTAIFFLFIHTTIATEITEVPINQKGSIYPRKIGNTKLPCRNRIIEYNLEIGDIRIAKENIQDSLEILHETCSNTEFHTICQYTISEIKTLITTIDNKYKIIESANIESIYNYRKKRNLDEIPEIMAKSITLSDYSYSDLKLGLDEIKTLNGFIRKFQNKQLNQTDYINFNSLATLIILKVRKQLTFSQLILDITLNPSNNKISELISLETLKEEFNIIQKEATKEHCHIPINLKLIEVAKYLKICKIKTEITGKTLYITIKVPTFHKITYELIQAIPIPFERKQSSYIITPNSPYYINYIEKDINYTYSIPLSLEERLNCTAIIDFIICFPKNPFRTIEIKSSYDNILISVCNIEQLETQAKWKTFDTDCGIKPIPHVNQLIYLGRHVYYLHVIKPTILRIRCNENSINTNLNNSVIIRDVKKDCFLHYDDGWFSKLNDLKSKTIYQFSNHHSPYSILKQDLIQKDAVIADNFTSIRNLQSEFGELQEQIRDYNNRPKIVTNILKSDELLIIIGVITLLMIATWALIAYCNYKTKIQFSTWQQLWRQFWGHNITPNNSSSMSTINEDNQPKLNYHFNFNTPSLPRKSNSCSSRNIPKSPMDSYDIPKSTPLLSNTPTNSNSTSENIPMIPLVEYAQVNKKPRTSL